MWYTFTIEKTCPIVGLYMESYRFDTLAGARAARREAKRRYSWVSPITRTKPLGEF
jgi:hypothetical protein